MQVNRTLFPVSGAYSAVSKLNDTLEDLQVQLATQKKASTLSALGSDRMFDLTIRSRLSRLDGYASNIDMVNLRLDFLGNSVSRLDEIEADLRSDLSASGVGSDAITMATATQTSYNRLDEVLTLLNGDLNGRYLFGGSITDSKPVVTADTLIDGTATRAGLKQVIAERKLADMGGTTGLGRVDVDQIQLSAAAGATNEVVVSESTTANGPVISAVDVGAMSNVTATPDVGPPANSTIAFSGLPNDGETLTITVTQPDGSTQDYTFTAVSGAPAAPGEFQIGVDADETATNFLARFSGLVTDNTVTLAEDGAHDFGVKLTGMSTDSTTLSVMEQTTTAPHVLTVRVDAQPGEGEVLTVSYTLPDGGEGSFDVAATTDDPPAPGQFLIGADQEETAANIASAMTAQLANLRDTDLAAASANQATEDLITTNGAPPRRVDGPPFDTATGMVDGTEANTVIWYTGESVAAGESARRTASARVGESTTAYYGVLGNEQGLADLVRASAVMAAESFSTDDDADVARYSALAQHQVTRLADVNNSQTGSIEVIALELGLAEATVGSASDRNKTYAAQLETMLADIESVDINEVAMQLLTVRTNLEASYQTMSTLSELSLVNFMR